MTKVKYLFILLLSIVVSTFPLVDYIKDQNILQDVGENIFGANSYYWDLIYGTNLKIIDYFKREWLWAFLTVQVGSIFTSYESYFIFIGGFNFFITSLFICKYTSYKYLFFLLLPIEIVFLIYQPRLAFASSIFLGALLIENTKVRYFLFFLTLLIHNAMLIILGSFFVISKLVSSNRSINVKMLLLLGYSLLVGFATGPMISIFMKSFGIQKESYDKGDFASSLSSLVFWLVVAILFVIQILKSKSNNIFFYLSIFFALFPVFSTLLKAGYPYRFLVAGFPFILIGVSHCDKVIRKLLICVLLFFWIVTSLDFYK